MNKNLINYNKNPSNKKYHLKPFLLKNFKMNASNITKKFYFSEWNLSLKLRTIYFYMIIL